MMNFQQMNPIYQINQMQMNQMNQMNQMVMRKKIARKDNYAFLIDQNSIKPGQYKHISIEMRIRNRLLRMRDLLMNIKFNQNDFYKIAREMTLLYYHFKLAQNSQQNPGQKKGISNFVAEAKVELTSMRKQLQQKNIEGRFKFELDNFIYNISKFDDIYQTGKQYFNLTTVFNMQYDEKKCFYYNTGNNKKLLIVKQTGLANIGATCYMNATLQSFFHTPVIRNYFKCLNASKRLSTSFTNTLKKSCNLPDPNLKEACTCIEPYDFKNTISEMNPLFAGINANDAKDLVSFMLENLHQELNTATKATEPINAVNNMPDQRDREATFKHFINDYYGKNKSVICNELHALNCNITCCSNCNVRTYNFQIYSFLIFPLDEVRGNVATKNWFKDRNQITTVSLQDCFEYNGKVDLMSGQNQMYCNYCRITCDSLMATHLVTVPQTLILLLNRGKGKEYDVKIDYSKYLDQYTVSSELLSCDKINMKWKLKKLISTISHLGESGMGGHFISFTKSQLDGQYYNFNDATVTPAQAVVSVDRQNTQNGLCPYMLFYSDMKAEEIIREIEDVVFDNSYQCCILGKLANLTDSIKREKFAYLLGCAMLQSEKCGLDCANKSDLVCATFELIKLETEFSEIFMEKCRIIICEMANRMKQKNRIGNTRVTFVDDIIQQINKSSFSLPNKNSFNANIFKNSFCYPDMECVESLVENQQNPYNQYNNPQNNDTNNNNNINNNEPDFITIGFELENNKAADCVVHNKNISLKEAFNLAKRSYPKQFQNCQYEDPVFTLGKMRIDSEETIANLMQNNNSDKITFKVKDQKLENININLSNNAADKSSDTSNSPSKLADGNKSKWIWLKIFFTSIFAIVAIFLIILKLYWFVLIPVGLIFSLFIVPKLWQPCCGWSRITRSSSYNYRQCQRSNSRKNVPNLNVNEYNDKIF